jgi:hypothetical protein
VIEAVFYNVLLVLLVVVLATGSVWLGLRVVYQETSHHYGPWVSNRATGVTTANPWLKAHVALKGLMALNPSEAVYFTATRDDQGRVLRSANRYEIIGKPLPSKWWSLTVYGSDLFLIPNSSGRYSVSSMDTNLDDDGRFTVLLSTDSSGENWLPTGEGQSLTLTLRYYRPSFGGLDNIDADQLPAIRKVEG